MEYSRKRLSGSIWFEIRSTVRAAVVFCRIKTTNFVAVFDVVNTGNPVRQVKRAVECRR